LEDQAARSKDVVDVNTRINIRGMLEAIRPGQPGLWVMSDNARPLLLAQRELESDRGSGLQESLHPDPAEGRVLDSAESPHPITG